MVLQGFSLKTTGLARQPIVLLNKPIILYRLCKLCQVVYRICQQFRFQNPIRNHSTAFADVEPTCRRDGLFFCVVGGGGPGVQGPYAYTYQTLKNVIVLDMRGKKTSFEQLVSVLPEGREAKA
jgi:hypothetical protein